MLDRCDRDDLIQVITQVENDILLEVNKSSNKILLYPGSYYLFIIKIIK